jgi:2-oxoglutarate dehydrogenase E2 component (dihydrolipoamide succinyltransferase)
MDIELKIPALGESITEVEIGEWLKKPGSQITRDEPLVTLESDKATVELPASDSGSLTKVLKQKGEVAQVGEVIAIITSGAPTNPREKNSKAEPANTQPRLSKESPEEKSGALSEAGKTPPPRIMPAAERILAERGLKASDVQPTGPGNRLLKEDVLRHVSAQPLPASAAESGESSRVAPKSHAPGGGNRQQEIVPMTRLRRTVAERLVAAQHNAALLTTFNEVDMQQVMSLRKAYGEKFLEHHQVKLGFMSFFVKATVEALKAFPAVNAEIKETNIVYHNYCDIGVAVGSGKGLVVPVIKNAEDLSFAQIEKQIADFGLRARENKLRIEELQGGTFTISNGGVYGSLLSTPIVNPPQSGVLGMHAIQEQVVVVNGAMAIRPMMYIALTYDHRVVDGREAVSFLKSIKDTIEQPGRLLLEV